MATYEFDAPYGVSTVAITTSGFAIVSTIKSFYHGLKYINTSTDPITVTVYDNASTTSGNILDLVYVTATAGVDAERFYPVVAKSGIVIAIVGTANKGVVFFAPGG